MPRFKHYNYDQDAMVVINYQDQLQPGTFEHAIHYLIEHKLDLSVFHPKYRNEATGRLARAIWTPIRKRSVQASPRAIDPWITPPVCRNRSVKLG